MNPTNFSYLLIVYIPLYLATRFGLFKMFQKANVKNAWLAFIPIVAYYTWIKIVGRPKSWMAWAILPISSPIIKYSLTIDLMESFGKNKFKEQFYSIVAPFYYFVKVGISATDKYLGLARDPKFRKKYVPVKSTPREWADALFFAFVVAYVIRTFQMEPYKIPTASMEDSMLVGDYLVVSKINYGSRFPITPISFPLFHQDFAGFKTYSDLIKLPYMRFPGFQKLERNSPLVFNVPWDFYDATERYPDKMQNYVKRCVGLPGDTIELRDGVLFVNGKIGYQSPKAQFKYHLRFKDNVPTRNELATLFDIYDFEYPGYQTAYIGLDEQVKSKFLTVSVCEEDLEKLKNTYKIEAIVREISPKGKEDFIDFQTPVFNPKHENIALYRYNAMIKVKSGTNLADKDFRDLNIVYFNILNKDLDSIMVYMDPAKIKNHNNPKIDTIHHVYNKISNPNVFPQNQTLFPFNKDNFGPIYLPKRGQTIAIDANNYYIYFRAIANYEGNESFTLKGSTVYLNDNPITEYTFKYDYYWLMGDNRDNSLDSRAWGYVPENHVVGKPLFVFFSVQTHNTTGETVKIRWNRTFKSIK